MILVGNVRAGGQDLARHLMSPDNERVTVHSVDGFASDDLHGAFKEAEAYSRGTRCKKYLYSLSFNPPANENVGIDVFEDAIDRAEITLGLIGQPRAVVFHEKENRRHCHVVWSRIDTEAMKAISMSYPKLKLKELAKDLYLEHEWDLPKGFIDPKLRDPKNLTLAEWQQAKRFGKDPREVKAIFQDSWKRSDSKAAFAHALKEHGLALARGDKRGYVATDMKGKVYPISRWVGIKPKEVKARLGATKDLPSLDEAKTSLADRLVPTVERLQQEQHEKLEAIKVKQDKERAEAKTKADAQRGLQQEWQKQRETIEVKKQQERFNNGVRGIVDRVTGKHTKTKQKNALEAFRNAQRDQTQRDTLILKQQDQKERLTALQEKAKEKPKAIERSLQTDMERLKALREQPRPSPQSRDGPER